MRRLPYRWTCQFRARIGFAGFLGIAPQETLSGSMRDRKSRAHAWIMSYSPKCPEIEGLNGGEGRIRTPGAMRVSSLPKAARNWLCLWRTRLLSNKRSELSLSVRLDPRWIGARLKCVSSARATSSVLPDSTQNPQGEIRHQGICPPCQHAPIVDRAMWDKVAQSLRGHSTGYGPRSSGTKSCVL